VKLKQSQKLALFDLCLRLLQLHQEPVFPGLDYHFRFVALFDLLRCEFPLLFELIGRFKDEFDRRSRAHTNCCQHSGQAHSTSTPPEVCVCVSFKESRVRLVAFVMNRCHRSCDDDNHETE
jgi:hypothetical protein